MATALTGKTPGNTYTWLIHFQGNGSTLDVSTPKPLVIGDGTELPLAVTTSNLYVGGNVVVTAAVLTPPTASGGVLKNKDGVTVMTYGTGAPFYTTASFAGNVSVAGTTNFSGSVYAAAINASSLALSTPLAIGYGGTGANTEAGARAALGAVGLTGNETIAGNKSFSGQTELTGQAATNATSAMTRALSDARYGSMIVTKVASNQDITAASFADIPATVTALESASDYEIRGFLAVETTGGSPTNRVQFRFGYSGTLQAVQGLNVNLTNSGTIFPMINGALLTSGFADTSNVDRTYPVIGYIRTNAAGNFSLQAYRITGGTVNPKLLAGSILTFRKL